MLKSSIRLKYKFSQPIRSLFFLLGFLLISMITAKAITLAVYKYGVLVDPKTLIYAAIFGVMIVVTFVYARSWRGFVLFRFSARPVISLRDDVIGLKSTKWEHICKTNNGYRAFFEIKMPFIELTESLRETHRPLRILLRQKILSAVYFEDLTAPRQYKIDPKIEKPLRRIMEYDNLRLKESPSRGVIRMQICVEVEDIETALTLNEESSLIEPIPYRNFASSFFRPGMFQQAGAISYGEAKAYSIPSVVELLNGSYLPILITGYEQRYQHQYNHKRFQDLGKHLERPILWHALVFDIPKSEIGRISRVHALESAFPKGLLDSKVREAFDRTPDEIEELKSQLKSGRKPRLLKQVVWIKLQEGDRPRLIFQKAQEWLFERHLSSNALNPTRALALFASLHPGLERHAADSSQGLGVAGEEDEISSELEALASWYGHQHPNQVLQDFAGKTLNFGLFEGGNNFNVVIVGEPGSGKSVVINGLTASHLARSRYNRAVLVDYGGSFSGLVEAIDGTQISYKDRGKLKISPIPVFPDLFSEVEFYEKYQEEDYDKYLSDQENLRTELRKQSLIFIKDYLCNRDGNINDNAVFQEAYFEILEHYAKPENVLEDIISQSILFATQKASECVVEIRKKAYTDVQNLLIELQSVCKISPFIGDNALDLRDARLVSFNLDGFSDEDKNVLVGLINLLIQQTFGDPASGLTLIVFDEVHKFIRSNDGTASGLGKILDSTSRVTRKYGSSLVLASQSPKDYDEIPSLIENANHHYIMRLKMRELSAVWKVVDPELIEHARTKAEPADAVGYSTIHLGTTTKVGDIQGKFKYKFTPIALYPFTSKIKDKQIMDLTLHLTGITNYIDLAAVIHRADHIETKQDQITLIPIGSSEYWQVVSRHIKQEYIPVASKIPILFSDREVNPFLDQFLDKNHAEFEQIAKNHEKLERFIQKHYEKKDMTHEN